MWRRRRVLSIALLLLIVLGAAGGYRLAHGEGPSPVLRTLVVAGGQPGTFYLDEGGSRLYFLTDDPARPLGAIDTSSGTPVRLRSAIGAASGVPLVDHRSGHSFAVGAQPGRLLMIDTRTGAPLRPIPVPWTPGTLIAGTLDERRDRILAAYGAAPAITVIDGRTGAVLRTAPGCTAGRGLAISRATQRLFEPCLDGGFLVFDSWVVRLLARIPASALGNCYSCSVVVDEATRRLFLHVHDGVEVLDARTGARVLALPLPSWDGGSLGLLPGGRQVVAVPYADPALGHAERTVLVLDGRTGAILRRWAVPENPTQVMVNPLTGHLLVASAGPRDPTGEPLGRGTLSVLDARSGAVLHQVETGILPGQLAADSRARHLFVVNFDTSMDDQLSPLSRSDAEGWWPQTLRRLKGLAGWLPFDAPAPPTAGTTVTMLDLTQL